jgi:Condensation domain/TubC N-terminal docking domain
MSSSVEQAMPIEHLLRELRAQDIQLRAEGGDLRVSAPPGALTSDLREALSRPPLVRVNRDRELPLSFAQERMWILQQMDPEPNPHRLQLVFLLKANVADLQRAWNALVDRHEILRTTYHMKDDGRLEQVVHAPQRVELPVVDSSGVADTDLGREMRRRAQQIFRLSFDLEQGPVWRVLVFQLREGLLGAALCIHHIASDGWSLNDLIKELNVLCGAYAEGSVPQLAVLPVQYADYAVWQRQWLQGERLERELSYWRQRLAGMPLVLDLPIDYPRPAVQMFNGAGCGLELPDVVAAGIAAIGHRCLMARGIDLICRCQWRRLSVRWASATG